MHAPGIRVLLAASVAVPLALTGCAAGTDEAPPTETSTSVVSTPPSTPTTPRSRPDLPSWDPSDATAPHADQFADLQQVGAVLAEYGRRRPTEPRRFFTLSEPGSPTDAECPIPRRYPPIGPATATSASDSLGPSNDTVGQEIIAFPDAAAARVLFDAARADLAKCAVDSRMISYTPTADTLSYVWRWGPPDQVTIGPFNRATAIRIEGRFVVSANLRIDNSADASPAMRIADLIHPAG